MNDLFQAAMAGDIQFVPPPRSKDDRTEQERADGETLVSSLVPPDSGPTYGGPGTIAEPESRVSVAVAMLSPAAEDVPDGEPC